MPLFFGLQRSPVTILQTFTFNFTDSFYSLWFSDLVCVYLWFSCLFSSRVNCTVCPPVTPVECTSCWFLICSCTTRTNTAVPLPALYDYRSEVTGSGWHKLPDKSIFQMITSLSLRSLISCWWWGLTLFTGWECQIKTESWDSARTATVTWGKMSAFVSHIHEHIRILSFV